MKKSLILLLLIGALVVTPLPARAGGISFGIPLPFPFVFYNFGSDQPCYGGYYSRPYGARPYYHRRAYYYGGYYGGYFRPRYYYGSRYSYFGRGW
jgi:hypothetical protein